MPITKTIIPTSLVYSKQEFKNWVNELKPYFNSLHIDIVDSSYGKESWFDEIDTFNEAKDFKRLRIHLMLEDPILFLNNKKDILKKDNVLYLLPYSKISDLKKTNLFEQDYKVGLVFEPQDKLNILSEDVILFNEFMFMGVNPGESGRSLDNSVFSKVNEFKKKYLINDIKIPVSIDGGFSEESLHEFLKSSVDIIYTNTFLKNEGVENAINKLKSFE